MWPKKGKFDDKNHDINHQIMLQGCGITEDFAAISSCSYHVLIKGLKIIKTLFFKKDNSLLCK